MSHDIHRVVGVEKVAHFVRRVSFDDDTAQTIDFRPVLTGELYGPLSDPRLFEQVTVDPEAHTLVWPNGADFDPSLLHNWPAVRRDLEELARSWQLSPV